MPEVSSDDGAAETDKSPPDTSDQQDEDRDQHFMRKQKNDCKRHSAK